LLPLRYHKQTAVPLQAAPPRKFGGGFTGATSKSQGADGFCVWRDVEAAMVDSGNRVPVSFTPTRIIWHRAAK